MPRQIAVRFKKKKKKLLSWSSTSGLGACL